MSYGKKNVLVLYDELIYIYNFYCLRGLLFDLILAIVIHAFMLMKLTNE